MIATATVPGCWVAGYSRLERERPDAPGARWLAQLRRVGMERFSVLGIPDPHQEEWRKTNVSPIARVAFEPANGAGGNTATLAQAREQLARLAAAGIAAPALVFINGIYAAELSDLSGLPEGIEAGSLAQAASDRRDLVEAHLGTVAADLTPFTALNTAFLRDGVFVHLASTAQSATPVHLVFLTARGVHPLACHPRVLVVAEPGSRGRLVEVHAGVESLSPPAAAGGPVALFVNPVTEIVLSSGSVLDYDVVQPMAGREWRIASLGARIGPQASFSSRSICLGGPLVRNDVRAVLEAEGASCTLDGLFLVRYGEHVDNHTVIDHARPGGTSRELYKGILASGGRGVFDGKIVVRPDARKTDAMQANRNLLLADDAVMDTLPKLEILNNDVKCKHAATIGRLDETAVFYLRSRAVGVEEARRILIQAFADEVIGRLPAEPLRAPLSAAVTDLLAAGPEAGGRT